MYQPHSTQHYHRNDEVNDNNKITSEAKLHEHKQQLQEEEEEEEYIINEEDDDVIIDDDDDDYNDDYVDENNNTTSKYNIKQQQQEEMELPNAHQHYINHVDKKEITNKPMPYLPEEESELLYNEEELEQMYMESEGEDIDEQEEEIDEEGEINDEKEEDEEDKIMQEEDDIPTYPLPPLPPIELPATIHGTSTHEMYNIISEIRRLIDDSVERERVKEMLLHDPHVLAGVAQVLHECGLLRRPVIQPMSHNIITHELLPLPLGPTPPLPAGYTSWIVDEPAAVMNTAQTPSYNNTNKDISHQ